MKKITTAIALALLLNSAATIAAGTKFPPPANAGTKFPPPADAGTKFPPPADAGTKFPPPADAGTKFPPPADAGTKFPPPSGAIVSQDSGSTTLSNLISKYLGFQNHANAG